VKVSLLASTPDPERVVAAAARLCYSASGIDEIMSNDSGNASLINKVIGMNHLSVLEHIGITFGIEGVSRALSHQLVRHRIASFSQQSQRYVKVDDELGFESVKPPSVSACDWVSRRYDVVMNDIHDLYQEMLMAGIPAEDARFVLPNAAATKLVMTMNARELRHFLSVRCCNRAQWEIRAMAKEILKLCRETAPTLFADAGPGCLRGACPEGSMSCGSAGAVRRELGV